MIKRVLAGTLYIIFGIITVITLITRFNPSQYTSYVYENIRGDILVMALMLVLVAIPLIIIGIILIKQRNNNLLFTYKRIHKILFAMLLFIVGYFVFRFIYPSICFKTCIYMRSYPVPIPDGFVYKLPYMIRMGLLAIWIILNYYFYYVVSSLIIGKPKI